MGDVMHVASVACVALSACALPAAPQQSAQEARGTPVAPKVTQAPFTAPAMWEYSAPLVAPEPREREPSRAQKDPSVVFHDDDTHAYLFYTSLDGRMWRLRTPLARFPNGFGGCSLALRANVFEASHTYRLKGQDRYLTIIEADGRRHYKAYVADRLDGRWTPVADSEEHPFAGFGNIRPAAGVPAWTDNVSHGELLRCGVDQTLTVDPDDLRLLFQGMLDRDKRGEGYGAFGWRLGLLTPAAASPRRPVLDAAIDARRRGPAAGDGAGFLLRAPAAPLVA